MMVIFRKDKKPVISDEKMVVTDYVPIIMMLGHVVLLIIASFFQNKSEITNGVICMAYGIINIVWEIFLSKGTDSMWYSLKAIDYDTMFLLAGLFCVISGIINVGIIDELAIIIADAGNRNAFLLYTVIVFWLYGHIGVYR